MLYINVIINVIMIKQINILLEIRRYNMHEYEILIYIYIY